MEQLTDARIRRLAENGYFDEFSHLIHYNNVKEFVPKFPGVYKGFSITKKENLHLSYVGLTKNLRERLYRHDNCIASHYQFRVIEDEEKRRELEKKLIRELDPCENVKETKTQGMREYEWHL